MPDITLTVDGQVVTVPAGTNIVDAARAATVAVPVFCYHPKMKPVGMCRMCLVEVYTPKIDPATRQPVIGADGKPELALMMNKLQAGCVTPVSEGMVVKTVGERVEFAQRGVLEFLLTSHPLDCPVCDKGGECPLQNLTMQWGPGNSRYDYSDKHHNVKPIALGDLIYLDRERCILCARCVRFQDEIAGDPVLGFDNRGRAWEIISKSDPPFDSKFSGNTTDICPVGALTSADFRFKARVWELRSVPSVCNHCSVGCDISLDMRYNDLMRVMPRENDFVNEIWTCDKGRYGMRYIGSAERLKAPMIRRAGGWAEATWEEAYQYIADHLTLIRANYGAAALGGLAGAQLPNEDLYLFQKLFRETLGTYNLDHRAGTPDEPATLDDLPNIIGVGAGTNLTTLGKGTAVLVIGADPEEEAPLYVLRIRGIADRGGELSVVNSYPTKLARGAQHSASVRAGAEAVFVQALLSVIFEENLLSDALTARLRGLDELRGRVTKAALADLAAAAGVAEAHIRAIARSFAKAENGIIVYGRAAQAAGPALSQALANLALITGKAGRANSGVIALTAAGNTRGALALGVRPERGPGGIATTTGLSAREMWAAAMADTLKGMYIAGMNPARSSAAAAEALGRLEFLVVQDLFMTETAQLAHVVLPAATIAEREGTFTNAERRVQRFRQARRAEGDAPADWQAFQEVARAVLAQAPAAASVAVAKKSARVRAAEASGTVAVAASTTSWDYVVASDIADEISATVSGYKGTSYTSLAMTNASWGRRPNEAFYYDGTSYENSEGLGLQLPALADDGKSAFQLAYREPAAADADANFPLVLLTVVRAYDSGAWMRGSKLQARAVPAHVILSVADAQAIGVGIGETVRVSSASGSIELRAMIDAGLSAGLVLLPLIKGLDLAQVLSGPQTRVALSKLG
ncbi:MAG: NADH-quinone oxidoreductase subunit NuoG [Kouleothrix sp.]|jgi:NADH-quinone oxidoreductase subunit G|nr:NADH-quinone oxidoreductase subunit NuoG [Kouleothrix sp.]